MKTDKSLELDALTHFKDKSTLLGTGQVTLACCPSLPHSNGFRDKDLSPADLVI